MKTALDAYRDLKRELDKNESPSFSIRDFNYVINSGIDGYVGKVYSAYPVIQKSLDELRAVTKTNITIVFTANQATLHADYRHMLNLRVNVKFLVADGRYAKDQVIEVYPEREQSGMEGFNQNNAFHRASYKTPYYNIIGDTIILKLGDKVTVDSASYDYVRIPDTIYLNPDRSSNYTLPENNTEIDFPLHSYYQIIKETRRIVLENIESPRYQSTLQEQQIRP